jgi:L-fuculose-phosphate aldolase
MEEALKSNSPCFKTVGERLSAQGLVSVYSGNLSIRIHDKLIITRSGSALSTISEDDLVETGIATDDSSTPLASSELNVHRSIYQNTLAQAVVHAHPPYAIVLSFIHEKIVPCDMEGYDVLSSIPVLVQEGMVKAGDLSKEITETMRQHKIVLVRSHGTFAAARSLEEAYYYTTVFERSCRILYLLRALNPGA